MGVNGIYGLSGSGLDIESMVKVGMMSKQNEYDKMAQKYTKNEWTKTELIDLNNQITTFNMTTLSQYKMSSSMNSRDAESSDETAVKATANATAALMSHRVDVESLSSNAYLISKNIENIIAKNTGITDTKELAKVTSKGLLKDIFFSNLSYPSDVTVTGNNVATTKEEKTSFADNSKIVTTTNADGSKKSEATLDGTNPKLTVNTSTDGSTKTLNLNSDTLTLKTNSDGSSEATLGSTTLKVNSPTTNANGTKTTTYEIAGLSIPLTTNGNRLSSLTGTNPASSVAINFSANTKTLNYNNGQATLTLDETTGDVTITSGSSTFKIDNTGSITEAKNTNGSSTFQIASDGTITAADNANDSFTVASDGSITALTTNNTDYTKSTDNTTITETTTFNYTKYADPADNINTESHDGTLVLTKSGDGTITGATYTDAHTAGQESTSTLSDLSKITTENGVTTFNFGTGSDYPKVTLSDSGAVSVITRENGITGTTYDGTEVSAGFSTGYTNRTVAMEDKAIAFKLGDGTHTTEEISFTYGDLLNGGKTINDLVSTINTALNAADVNMRAMYDNLGGRLSFYNTKSGDNDESKILITAVETATADAYGETDFAGKVAMSFFNSLNLYQSKDGELHSLTGDSSTTEVGSTEFTKFNVGTAGDPNAAADNTGLLLTTVGTAAGVSGEYGSAKIDGVTYDKVEDNKVSVGGITYNFLNVTKGTNATTGVAFNNPVTVSVTQDVDAIVDKVKSFVADYNKILSSLYEKYDEKGDSNYKPLTQSQKDAMTEEQIKKWEEKAKQGLLYHDATLAKIIGDMRNAISTPVEGVSGIYNSAYSIGIGTTGIKGQLVLDETRLRNALAEDGDSVYNVFAKLDANDEASGNGVAQRLGDVFTAATKAIKSRAGSSADITEDSDLNTLLRELQTKMSNFKKLMTSFENALYKKYDAMESTLAKLGMQMNYIMGGQQ